MLHCKFKHCVVHTSVFLCLHYALLVKAHSAAGARYSLTGSVNVNATSCSQGAAAVILGDALSIVQADADLVWTCSLNST